MKIKLWSLLVLLCSILIILRAEQIIDIFHLMYLYSLLLVTEFPIAANHFSLNLADHFISAILIVLIPAAAIIWKKKSILSRQINFNSVVLTLLGYSCLFAPLICDTNPEFQRDLKVTKLLPPVSYVKVIDNEQATFSSSFASFKDRVIKNSFNNSLIYADSVNKIKNIYYQGSTAHELKGGMNAEISDKLFILGTDEFGRDVFARLIYGARISLFVGLGSVIMTFLLGIILGFLAGYLGGITDIVLNRMTEMLLAFPAIFLIILLIALFGSSLFTIIIVFGFSGWMSLFKIVRGEVISVKQKDYFISAKMAGLTNSLLLRKEIFPVVFAPVIVNLVLLYGNVILAEAALSYLGLGTGLIYPSWGSMIQSGQEYLTEAWWMIFFPGAALFITLFTANNLGRQLMSYYNPRLRHD